jgi:tetratricopeptide (TPR) repeat protein
MSMHVPPPFVWLDVAIVHIVCALPLAYLLAGFARGLPRLVSLALATCFIGLTLLAFTARGQQQMQEAPGRMVVSLAFALGCMLAWPPRSHRYRGWPSFLLAGLVLVALPTTYVAARRQHDERRLGELLEQSRFAEAQALASALKNLGPTSNWRGRHHVSVWFELQTVVARLEAQAQSLQQDARPQAKLERARVLAMLDRTEAALDLLDEVRDPAASAEVANLRGTILEARRQWQPGLAAYQEARRAAEASPLGPTRDAGLLRAVTGIAYCQRKSGDYDAAAASYHERLELAPTAESHFLLAQFYDDSQDAAKARVHARQAMALAPERYRSDGERILRKLAVFHFGCLGVSAAEQ